ncbi:uncharacterized protein BT62DRAFT_992651 [Guyanagaster necrorhizus]|uniref:Uncharacterized protein n=1 Tax=Guyanagaster necrorhizus TaxID=856835 RepID=A0A9P7VYM0_9AGAR|nr:uncharacterized protein BT62DRAFT_992651 [Guyanagaster necrorhizus MCA 3950]KAG7448634.1 hypothetical protein BT62DRAFT_992651 [Guyanagaster necrorhizus MCA 3950]
MATPSQTNIPPDLSGDDKANLFEFLDVNLNSTILHALLYGIYTGILAVTLWNIFINKCWPIRRAMVAVIILLHALVTINFTANWSYIRSAFIENGQSFRAIYSKLESPDQTYYWETSIAASMSTILADLYMIWCCWMVWGRRWLIVLLPILSLVSAIGMALDPIYSFLSRIIEVYHAYFNPSTKSELFQMLYISFILATTLWCTLFIIYRILTVAGIRHREEGRLRVYHRFLEVLVESSALYSISLILDLAFTIRYNWGEFYLDVIAAIAKGIAPTLLVGRMKTGHRAHPDDSWQGSMIASVSIRSCSQEDSQTSFQEDRSTNLVHDGDLEAQPESGDPSTAFFPGPSAVDHACSIAGHGDCLV